MKKEIVFILGMVLATLALLLAGIFAYLQYIINDDLVYACLLGVAIIVIGFFVRSVSKTLNGIKDES